MFDGASIMLFRNISHIVAWSASVAGWLLLSGSFVAAIAGWHFANPVYQLVDFSMQNKFFEFILFRDGGMEARLGVKRGRLQSGWHVVGSNLVSFDGVYNSRKIFRLLKIAYIDPQRATAGQKPILEYFAIITQWKTLAVVGFGGLMFSLLSSKVRSDYKASVLWGFSLIGIGKSPSELLEEQRGFGVIGKRRP